MDGEGGDDEAAEGEIVLVRIGTYKLHVCFSGIASCEFSILGILVLPEGEALRIGHLRFTLLNGLREGLDNRLAVLGNRSGIWMTVSISFRSSVACTHDDVLLTREFARHFVKRGC